MKIIEYEEKYLEDVRDLLVELEEYIFSIDEYHLDKVGDEYREKMALYDLDEVAKNNGKCFLAIEDDNVVGLIMGTIPDYDDVDHLDYKCPRRGIITELIISSKYRKSGIGNKLMNELEKYFLNQECEYILVEAFAYNKNAINFYDKSGYHPRMFDMIKKIK